MTRPATLLAALIAVLSFAAPAGSTCRDMDVARHFIPRAYAADLGGAVTTAAAYAIYSIGLRRVPASVAGIVTLLEPLTATLLGVLIFGERLGSAGIVGALLLLSALGLLAAGAGRQADWRG